MSQSDNLYSASQLLSYSATLLQPGIPGIPGKEQQVTYNIIIKIETTTCIQIEAFELVWLKNDTY